jgi:hypothetical protein
VRRWLAAIAAAVLLLAAIAGLVAWLRFRNGGRTTTVSAEEALNRYRESAASTTTPTTSNPAAAAATTSPTTTAPLAVLPQPGVYTYATSGNDGVDALGGARHQYPATTTITVTPSGCGVVQRWVAAVERWDETTTCATAGGTNLVHFTGFHRFFGGDSYDDYSCTGEPRPVRAAAGTTWTVTCVASDETTVHRGTVVGSELVDVNGQSVPTLHVTDLQDDGDPSDHQVTDTWYQEGTDLVVRRISRIATSSSSPVGVVHYDETYEIDLQSLVPQQ